MLHCLARSPVELQGSSNLAANIGLVACGRINRDCGDLFRRVVGHGFNVHAAFSGGNEGDAGCGAVDEDREIKFAGNGRAFLDVKALHQFAFRPGLRGHEVHAEDAAGFGFHISDGFDHLDATALATATGVDLGLDDPDRAGLGFCSLDGFINGESGRALARGHAEFAQHGFGLVFVDVHVSSPLVPVLPLAGGGAERRIAGVRDVSEGWYFRLGDFRCDPHPTLP